MVLICWLLVNIISDSYLPLGYLLLATSLFKSFVHFVLVSGASLDSQLFLRPDPNINYLSGLAWRRGNKDTTYMVLSGGRFLVVPHEVLSLHAEEFFLFILQTAFIPKHKLSGKFTSILSPR